MDCLQRSIHRAAWLALALSLAWGWGTPVTAADENPPAAGTLAEAGKDKKTMKLEDVVVRGDAILEGLEATSAKVLDNAEISERVYVTPLDIVKSVPGVTINQYHQGGTAAAFQMRGFTSASHGPDVAIFLDGVPLNETDGYADTNIVIPEEIERVEVVKGPASALYGNYASAGSVAFNTIKSGDFTRFKLRYGSFNTQEMVGVVARRDGDVDHVYAGQLFHTDGFQSNSKWDKQNGAARWTYHVNDRLDASLGVRAFNSTWDAPGYIPQAVYDNSPNSAINNVNGGWKKREEARGDIGYKLSENSKLLFYAWAHQQDFTRWYQNWVSPSQRPGSNYGDERYFQREVFGSGVSYNYLGKVLERQTRFVIGLDWMREFENRERWNLTVGNGRTRGSKYQDYDITLYTTALYAELNYQLYGPLRAVLGSRYDIFNGSLNERLPSGTWDRNGPEVFSPKAGLVLTLTQGWDLFANYGRGFALPRGTDLWKRSYLDPAIRTQYESGLKARPNKWSDYALTFWRLDTDNDFQPTLSDPNTLENAGQTRRQGLEAEANFYPWKHLRLRLDYAYIDTEYLEFRENGLSRNGNQLASVPHHVFNAELGWQPPQGWGARLGYRYVSEWYLDAANSLKADGFDSLNAQVSYRFNRRYKLTLDVINLLDKKYSEYLGYANGVLTYAPADPLSAYLTLTIDW